MRSTVISVLLNILAVAGLCRAEPTPPGLTYLYTANITGGTPIPVGDGPHGTRLVFPILGGNFKGPRLSGSVVPVGADWLLVDKAGIGFPDVRQTFKTDDGAYIQVFETGAQQQDGTIHARLTFETGSEKYYWINYIVGVAVLRVLGETDVSIDAWQLTTAP